MPKFIDEFKAFVMRGNVVDMAVGIVIGGAFGKIVTSLVNDIIMPPIGLILGQVNFSDLFFSLNGQVYPSIVEAQKAGAPTLNYGLFLNTIINFLIVAAAIFILIKQINRFQKPQAKPVAAPSVRECPQCVTMISIKAKRCPQCTSEVPAAA